MASFKVHKVAVNHLLGVIPEGLLSQLSDQTQVDYYAKALHGRKMFYLLLYGILENDRLSQRTLEDTFNDSIFKTLFALDPQESVRRSSISERLDKIDSGLKTLACISTPGNLSTTNADRYIIGRSWSKNRFG